MLLHGSVGVTDRPQAEVVSPTINLPIERCYQRCRILLGLTPAGHLADRLTQTLHSFLRGSGAPVGPPRLRRVASTKRIPKKIELLFRQLTDPRLTFVHRQLQPRHHAPHRRQRSEEHTSELQSHLNLVCRLLLEKKKNARSQSHMCPTARRRPQYTASARPPP